MRADLLILSAHFPELSGLASVLGGGLRRSLGGIDVAGAPAGIGIPAAAVGASVKLRAFEPRAVIFLGTCGAYPGRGPALGEVVMASRLFLVSPPVIEARAAFPPTMTVVFEVNQPLTEGIAGENKRPVAVATTLAITTDDALAARLAADGAYDVEHLESFAIAAACAAVSVPFAIVLGVANMVGSKARAEWAQNHRAAGEAASATVANWLERGAPGFVRT